jgi:hypothetical protein
MALLILASSTWGDKHWDEDANPLDPTIQIIEGTNKNYHMRSMKSLNARPGFPQTGPRWMKLNTNNLVKRPIFLIRIALIG